MKEFCKCGHSKRNHLIEFDRTTCCCMWESKKTGYIVGCGCSSYEPEVKELLNSLGEKDE